MNPNMTLIPGPYMSLKLSLVVARRAIPFAFGIHEIFERAKVVWQVVQRYCLPEKVGRRT